MVEGLDMLLADQDQAGILELRNGIDELIKNRYGRGLLISQEKIKQRVFRLHFDLGNDVLVLILKCMEGRIARRNELVARRWLPAEGLTEAGPSFLTAVGTPSGESVWHIYRDLGPWSLAEDIRLSRAELPETGTRWRSRRTPDR